MRTWADELIYREDGQFEISEANVNAYFKLAQYFDDLSRKLAEQPFDPDDMFSCVLQAEKDGKLTHDDVIGFGILLAVAGNETTTKLIGNMGYRLWQHPQQRQLLIDDPSRIADAVETLRFDGSTQMIGRTVTKDIEIRGQKIAGAQGLNISASRDKSAMKMPMSTMYAGDAPLAFGVGIHACLGSALARLEVRVCFEELLKAIPGYDLDLSRSDRTHNPNVRGFTTLPMRFRPRQAGEL